MLLHYPAELPITARRDEILAALRERQVVIVAGETGSGKTTQLPKMCVEAGFAKKGVIGCTQPRRVAATSVSRRVAEETRVRWGGPVGCKMRFSDDTSRDTVLKFMTDGILLSEVQSDARLRSYSALIIDEAHERSLNIDFLLGHLKSLLPARRDLRLIITSATIDTQAFSQAFGGAPVIEVSGRTYPVEVRYAPPAAVTEDGEPDFIAASVSAAGDALIESDDGDVLIFMPTERDIRETCEGLSGRLGSGFDVLPLYGRQSSGDQQKVFAFGKKRRVIVATNVAETSLTIPRIRWVIDTGLARISHYAPRTRTKRLPVEPVSQSSACQRAGRAGRVRDGVCVRLYAEDDFLKRPLFTRPEIQRANLAEVILRLKAFRLGDIESFPFLNPPAPAAIRAGYLLLHELGALDDTHELTGTGRELARLPVDPTLGRMLLQARHERVLPEMLVIAAGLSVPDPRERPDDAKEAAEGAHRAFMEKESDFLSMLKLWLAAEAGGWQSANALRRFCKKHYLSFVRMREWRDIHAQLADDLEAERLPPAQWPDTVQSDALHRSVLAGLPSHLAQREERNSYRTSGARVVTVFPGSGLYARRDKAGSGPSQPEWMVASEIVQTSQLFARTAARVNPEWLIEVAPHVCEHRTSEPHWSAKSGRVLCTEHVTAFGMEVRRRRIDFGKADAAAATEIFIREVLIESEITLRHRFHASNQRLRQKLETALARVRPGAAELIAGRLFDFYHARLSGISSLDDLNRVIAAKGREAPDFLIATEDDLELGEAHPAFDAALYPDKVELGHTVLPLQYQYRPGADDDGVTVQVPAAVAPHLTSGQVQWMVPGLRAELAAVLLRALPKPLRRALAPLDPKIARVATEFDPGRREFLPALADFLTTTFHVVVQAGDWPARSLPDYLQPRIEVVEEKDGTVLAAGRDLAALRSVAEARGRPTAAWSAAAAQWERPAITSWSFGDLPDAVLIEHAAGSAVYGYPCPALRDDEVDVRLFKSPAERLVAAPAAVRRLAELVLARDIAWLHKEVRSLSASVSVSQRPANMRDALSRIATMPTSSAPLNAPSTLHEDAVEHILAHALRLDPVLPLKEARFRDMAERARREFPALSRRVRELTASVVALRREILTSPKKYRGIEADLARLVPPDFLRRTPHERLADVPRYLRAVQVRTERADLQPARDAERAKQLQEFDGWEQRVPLAAREDFRWLLEEFRVSIFAQELGTARPVSAKRLRAMEQDSV